MKLQAGETMVGRSAYGEGAVKDERAEPGGSSEILRNTLATSQRYCVRAVQDEDTAASHGLEVGGTLDGAQLPTRNMGAPRGLQANGISWHGPDVRVRLQNQRTRSTVAASALFAAFDEDPVEKRLRIGELGDALASGRTRAEVVREAFAMALRNMRARVNLLPTRAVKSRHGGHAYCGEPAECGDDAFVPRNSREGHCSALFLSVDARVRLKLRPEFFGDVFAARILIAFGIEAFDGVFSSSGRFERDLHARSVFRWLRLASSRSA